MIAPIRPTCATCRFFLRFTAEVTAGFERNGPELIDDSAADFPVLATENDTDLLEYGRCIRLPPQLLGQTLNGDWPVIHETRFCGEYRTSNVHAQD